MVSVETGEELCDTCQDHQEEDEGGVDEVEDISVEGSGQIMSCPTPSTPANLEQKQSQNLSIQDTNGIGGVLISEFYSNTVEPHLVVTSVRQPPSI